MLIKLAGGRVYDPIQGLAGEFRGLFACDGRSLAYTGPGTQIDAVCDVSEYVVMAGAIGIYSDITGGNVNTARVLLPEQHRNFMARRFGHPLGTATLRPELKREFSLHEIANMTPTAPTRLLGLSNRGHLAPGAVAGVAVYPPQAALALKKGRVVVRDGEVVQRAPGIAQRVQPEYDRGIERSVKRYFERLYSLCLKNFKVNGVDLDRSDSERFRVVPISPHPAAVQACR
jgi:formylmethanofuran dehydrogenase subunit A